MTCTNWAFLLVPAIIFAALAGWGVAMWGLGCLARAENAAKERHDPTPADIREYGGAKIPPRPWPGPTAID